MLLTSDRGLAGGFNANVFRVTQRFIAERKQATPPAREIVLEIVGKKGRDYYRRRRQSITRETPAPTAETATQIAREMAQIVSHEFHEGRTDAVFLVYNEFKSAVQQRVVVEPLLPVVARAAGRGEHRPVRPPARSTSSTSRRRRSCSTRCCRSTSSRRSTAASWSRSPPSWARA